MALQLPIGTGDSLERVRALAFLCTRAWGIVGHDLPIMKGNLPHDMTHIPVRLRLHAHACSAAQSAA